ncbi:MAG: hypothetical protein HY882_00450 [Deltaproteobacteria bacterium]|nr:hypothetical protein [Deltaproteobacteria bacterium]
MTHSLHREGTLDSLEQDYALFIYPARGFNYEGSGPKVRRLAELLYLQGPSNLIVTSLRRNLYSGVTQEEVLNSIQDGARIYCAFSTREKLKEALVKIKQLDEGISVVVSGLIDRVREVAAEVGLKPHTINLSLGIHGRTDRLPPPDIRQFTTMCGHGMVSPKLVRDVIRRVKTGKLDLWEASLILAAPCGCGIFNPCRSVEMLKDLVPVYTVNRL